MSDKVRKVPLSVSGYHIVPTGDADVGSTSGNSVVFQPRFDETWDGMSITAKFSDATKTVTIDVLLTDDQNADGSWNVPMPHEITQSEGDAELTFVGEAVEDDEVTARQTTKPFKFRVYESNGASVGDNTEPVAASDKQQLFDAIHVSEAYAKGTVNDIPVEEGETGYRDNAKYYAEEIAAAHASDASDSADAAAGFATLAESYAKGGTGTRSGEDSDNAKKYAENAAESASKAYESEENAEFHAGNASDSADEAAGYKDQARAWADGTGATGAQINNHAKYWAENKAKGYANSASESKLDAEDWAVGTRGGSAGQHAGESAKDYAEAAADAVEDALEAVVAAAFDPDTDYAVGDYCIYDGDLIRFTTAKEGDGEDVTPGTYETVTVTDDLKDKYVLPSDGIPTAHIKDGAVTTDKLNDGAVTSGKIENGAVGADQLAQAVKDGIDAKASSATLAASGGAALIGALASDGETESNVQDLLDGAAEELADKYVKPEGGVPSTDIADGAISWGKMNLNNVRKQFAPTFSSSRSYAAGEYVFYYDGSNWRLYKALMDVLPGEFDSNSWAALGTSAGGTICGDIARAISASISPGSFAELREIVRSGKVSDVLDVGDQLVGRIGDMFYDWDVEGIDEEINATDDNAHVLSLVLHNALADFAFDPTQYLFSVTAEACAAFGWDVSVGMPAGKYVVEAYRADQYSSSNTANGKYVFTTTQAISVGGGVRHSVLGAQNITQEGVLAGNFYTYGGDAPLTPLETLATTLYDEATDTDATYLGKTTGTPGRYATEGNYINYTSAQLFGSSRWSTSVIRHWLNSNSNNYAADFAASKPTIWSRPFDTMPSKGFLAMLDPAIRAVLVPIRKRYALAYSGGELHYEDVTDFVTLDTMLDVYSMKNYDANYPSKTVTEGAVNSQAQVVRETAMSYWLARTINADRVRTTKSGTAKAWWLGSLTPGTLRYARRTSSGGALGGQSSYYPTNGGVLPRIQIG